MCLQIKKRKTDNTEREREREKETLINKIDIIATLE
jgi:hypothetical protein